MNLLLTSKGITNKSIENALKHLIGKDFSSSYIGYVPTAALFSSSDKKWFVKEISTFSNLNPKEFKLIDFNMHSRTEIIKRLKDIDCLVLSGGSSSALMHAIDKKHLRNSLQEFAANKVYCGVSASSHIVSKNLALSNQDKVNSYLKDYKYKPKETLNWVDFYVRSHYSEPRYPDLTTEYLQKKANKLNTTVYGIDDQSAVLINKKTISVISEGTYAVIIPTI